MSPSSSSSEDQTTPSPVCDLTVSFFSSRFLFTLSSRQSSVLPLLSTDPKGLPGEETTPDTLVDVARRADLPAQDPRDGHAPPANHQPAHLRSTPLPEAAQFFYAIRHLLRRYFSERDVPSEQEKRRGDIKRVIAQFRQSRVPCLRTYTMALYAHNCTRPKDGDVSFQVDMYASILETFGHTTPTIQDQLIEALCAREHEVSHIHSNYRHRVRKRILSLKAAAYRQIWFHGCRSSSRWALGKMANKESQADSMILRKLLATNYYPTAARLFRHVIASGTARAPRACTGIIFASIARRPHDPATAELAFKTVTSYPQHLGTVYYAMIQARFFCP
jgi:hypothetical protein